jgi:hypothetical protein
MRVRRPIFGHGPQDEAYQLGGKRFSVVMCRHLDEPLGNFVMMQWRHAHCTRVRRDVNPPIWIPRAQLPMSIPCNAVVKSEEALWESDRTIEATCPACRGNSKVSLKPDHGFESGRIGCIADVATDE